MIYFFFHHIFKGTRHVPPVTSVLAFPLLLSGGNGSDLRTGAEKNQCRASSPVPRRRQLAEAVRSHCRLNNKKKPSLDIITSRYILFFQS